MTRQELTKELLENFIDISRLPFRKKTYELSQGEIAVMYYLYTLKKGLTVGELTELIGIGSGRMGDVLKALVEKGRVYREKDTVDKRRIIVYLSDDGTEEIKKQIAEGMAYMNEFADKLGDSDAEQLCSLMSKIVKSYTAEEE